MSLIFKVYCLNLLPINRNKWAILIEPSLQYLKSSNTVDNSEREKEFNSVELLFGVRHYLFLNNNSKIFIDGSVIFEITKPTLIEYIESSDLRSHTATNVGLGLGYKYLEKYSIQFRYKQRKQYI